MSLGLKIAASTSVVAGAAVLVVEAAVQGATVTGSPLADGLAGGGAVGVGLWLYLAKRLDDKADKSDVKDSLARIERSIETLTSHLLNDK